MGKNYTLYISHEPFAAEENKSGLINRLLDYYYNDPYSQTSIGDMIKTDIPEKIVKVFNSMPTASSTFSRASNGLCKLHGTMLDSNGKCTQKGHKKS